jgi:zinc protease
MSRAFLFAVFIFSSLISFAQLKPVEKVVRKGDEITIPYEKYVLSNGLTVLVHVDNSDPIVHVDVTYHVGSAREELGRSGFAHFFEHMMFQGSDHVADEEHFKIVNEAGGTLNGTTNTDRTNYFETVPANQLEVALWLEADRMGFLLDAVTQQKFEIQRATVKNERGQNVDNRPYGLVNEKVNQALYPYGHPYSWPTIGYMKDLDRVGVDDLKRFFLRWYGPNNAVLTVAGDVDPAKVIALAQKYFGPIPKGPEVKAMAPTPVKLESDRYISYGDNIRYPMINMSFPTVQSGHPDELPLDLLAEIIGGGQTSILYQSMVKTNIALQANAFNPCQELAGSFVVQAVPQPGKSLDEIEKLLRDAIKQFEKRGVTDSDVERFRNKAETDMIQGLSSVSGKASKLAYYHTFRNNPNYLRKEIESLQKLKKEDVVRVYNQYLKNKPAVILSVYEKGKKDVAKEDNFVPKISSDEEGKEGADYQNLKYSKAKDNFDRSIKPQQGPNPVVKLPEYWLEKWPNGIRLIGTEDNDLPTVSLLITFPAGHALEKKENAGIAQVLAGLLGQSTEKYTTEQKTEELEKLGSELSFSADRENLYVKVFSLKKNLKATLQLLEENMFHPRFDSSEFRIEKSQLLAAINNETTRGSSIANNVYNKLLYGEHIFGIPVNGTQKSVSNINLDDVKAFYRKHVIPGQASIVIVGQTSKDEITGLLTGIRNWNGENPISLDYPPTPEIEKTKIYFVHKENAPQSDIRIGYLALPYDSDGEFYKCGIMNYVLGGNFNSRINIMLREIRGFTYGANTGFSGTKFRGPFTAGAGVKAEKTDSALTDFFAEMALYRNAGIKDEELIFTKNSRGQQDALKYETPFKKASFLQRVIDYNLDKNFVERQNEILQKITKDEVNAYAKRYLPLENMIIVVVGDRSKVLEPLKKLGYEVVETEPM